MPSIKPDYPLDSVVLAVMREVHTLIMEMKLSYFVCGAVARDLLLSHVHGIEAGRVTADVDFAVAVEHWEQFYDHQAPCSVQIRLLLSRMCGFFVPARGKIRKVP